MAEQSPNCLFEADRRERLVNLLKCVGFCTLLSFGIYYYATGAAEHEKIRFQNAHGADVERMKELLARNPDIVEMIELYNTPGVFYEALKSLKSASS